MKDWVKSVLGVHETACFALDDPLPFFMMGVADGCEFYRWIRGLAAIRQNSRKAGSPIVLASQGRL